MDEIEKLVETLNSHAIKYYVHDNPTISDKEYDALYDRLVALEKETKIILDNSPTRRVGGSIIEAFSSHKHISRLYSLDKAQQFEGLHSFFDKISKQFKEPEYTLEYKFDGLTINLTYDKGKFVRATTRGNGEEGEDVTAQALTIKSFPLKIDHDGILEIQGEGIMRKSVFEKYNQTAKEPLKNPRNGVAGAIRNLDTSVTALRKLDIMFYSIGYDSSNVFNSQYQVMEFLRRNNFKTSELFFISRNREEIISKINDIDKNRQNLDFMIDGAVIKLNDFGFRNKLGYTEKFPRWALAFKFEAEEVTTILEDVLWNVGRTGKLTPLGLLQPVDLAGATISKATLNNMGDIERKGVKIGSRVLVRRSNDVIPEILVATEVHDTDEEILIPQNCPSCGSKLEWVGAHIFCLNHGICRSQIISKIAHFASKDSMNIEGFSEKTAIQLFDGLGVRSFSDLFLLTEDKLLTLDGFKTKKVKNVLNSISKSMHTELARFIHAICIPNIGKKTSKQLAAVFKSIDSLKQAKYEQLICIFDIGEIVAQSIVDYFNNDINVREIEKLFAYGITLKVEKQKSAGILSGEKVVLTGSLENFTRSEASKIIEDLGGEILSGINNETTLVLVGEKAGSKLEKAEKKGIKIIDETAFTKLIMSKEDTL